MCSEPDFEIETLGFLSLPPGPHKLQIFSSTSKSGDLLYSKYSALVEGWKEIHSEEINLIKGQVIYLELQHSSVTFVAKSDRTGKVNGPYIKLMV